MADDKKMIEVDGFPMDATVNIEIDGNMYIRLSQFMIEYSMKMGYKALPQFLAEMNTREPKNNYEYHVLTLLLLIGDIEEKLKETGQMTKIEVEDPDPDSDSSDVSETPDGN
jgi:hypothetical protein